MDEKATAQMLCESVTVSVTVEVGEVRTAHLKSQYSEMKFVHRGAEFFKPGRRYEIIIEPLEG